MIIRNCRKYNWVYDRKMQDDVITSEHEKSLLTSEASEVLFNNTTFNYCQLHRNCKENNLIQNKKT